jgi:hypothetical protein
MDIFVRSPILGCLPAIVFGAGFLHLLFSNGRKRYLATGLVFAASLAWAWYTQYELYVQRVFNWDIRVDLLAIYPVLILLTGLGIGAYLHGMGTSTRNNLTAPRV